MNLLQLACFSALPRWYPLHILRPAAMAHPRTRCEQPARSTRVPIAQPDVARAQAPRRLGLASLTGRPLHLPLCLTHLLLFGIVASVFGAEQKDPSGKYAPFLGHWNWQCELGQGSKRASLHVRIDESGETSAQLQLGNERVPVQKLAVERDKLRILLAPTATADLRPTELSCQVIRGELVGQLKFASEDQSVELRAHRKVLHSELVGAWQFRFTTPDQVELTPTFIISVRNEKLHCHWRDGDASQGRVDKVLLKQGQLVIYVTTKHNDFDVKARFEGIPHQGTLHQGVMHFEIDGNQGRVEVEGRRTNK